MSNPLKGICVLDCTQFLYGSYCSLVLADMGAEVIKVENNGISDFESKVRPQVDAQSIHFNNVNRNEKSISVDLNTTEGKEIFRRLVAVADVLLESNIPGGMDGLGFGYEDCKKINKNLVYASLSEWPGGPCVRSEVALAEVLGGFNAATGILGFLIYSKESGADRRIDLGLECGAFIPLVKVIANVIL